MNGLPKERDELAEYLESLDRESCYRVEATLKESPFEITQHVRFVGQNGATGPSLIRKFIDRDSGLGAAYERIFEAQQGGQRFKHVPDILECYLHDDHIVVVMEFVRGDTLQETVYQRDPSLALARDVFPRLCDAVAELHEDFSPPLIHRDLKPSNIILSDAGLTIIDFGIARDYREGAEADTARFGTRAFAPPEQFGYGQTTVRSDVYALGTLLYYCLTEQIPAAPLDEALQDARIPPAVREVIACATAFDPKGRFASARALKNAFLVACDEREADRQVPSGYRVPEHPNSVDAASQPRISPDVSSGAGFVWQTATPSEPGSASPIQQSTPPRGDMGPKTSTLGLVRNGFILFALAIFLAACVNAFVNPEDGTTNSPLWFNALGFLVIMPLFFIGTAVLLADKTWLKSRVALVNQWGFWRWLVAYLCLVAVLFLAIGVMSVFA